jgi:hypothetical protein
LLRINRASKIAFKEQSDDYSLFGKVPSSSSCVLSSRGAKEKNISFSRLPVHLEKSEKRF